MDGLLRDEELLELGELLEVDPRTSIPLRTPALYTQLNHHNGQLQQLQLSCSSDDPQPTRPSQLQQRQRPPEERCEPALGAFDDLTAAGRNEKLSSVVCGDHEEPTRTHLLLQQHCQRMQALAHGTTLHCYLPKAANAVANNNVTTCCGAVDDSSLRSATIAGDRHDKKQQALLQLLEADSPAAVFSIASEYFNKTLSRSSSPTSANTNHTEVMTSLDALMTVLQEALSADIEQQQQQQATCAATAIAAPLPVHQGRQHATCSGATGAYDVSGKEGQLLADELCVVLAAAASTAGGVPVARDTSTNLCGSSPLDLRSNRIHLSDMAVTCATAPAAGQIEVTDALFSSLAVMPPPPLRPNKQQQQHLPLFDMSAPNTSCSPAALSAHRVLAGTSTCSPALASARDAGQHNTALGNFMSVCATPMISEAAAALVPNSLFSGDNSSLADSLLQLQASCAVQSSQKRKQLSAEARLYKRQQQRCDTCASALHQTVAESVKVTATNKKFKWYRRPKVSAAV